MKEEHLYFYWNGGLFYTTQSYSLGQTHTGIYGILCVLFFFFAVQIFRHAALSWTCLRRSGSFLIHVQCWLCVCAAGGLLTSPAVHCDPHLFNANSHCPNQESGESFHSFTEAKLLMFRRACKQLTGLQKCLYLFKVDLSFLSMNA